MPKQAKLLADAPPGTPYQLADPGRYGILPPLQEFPPEAPSVPLSHYLWILRRHAWKIVAFVASCVLITFIISSRLKPIYESTATIEVDLQAPTDVVGQGASHNSQGPNPDIFLATQMKLIQSDAVLRPVDEQYLLANTSSQNTQSPQQTQPLSEAPVGLPGLSVTRPPNTYLLLITYRSPNPELAAKVANAVANSYLANTYNLRIQSSTSMASFMGKQLDELKAKMEKSGLALAQFEKDLDVINPEQKTDILSARLLQLNTEYTNAQTDRVAKEAMWNSIQSSSLAAAEISPQGQSLAQLNNQLVQAKEHLAEVKSTFGVRHPEYRKAAVQVAAIQKQFDDALQNVSQKTEQAYKESLNREQMLQQAVDQTKAEWDQLNARSFEYRQLKQEADADRTLYDELITKIREADINQGFQNNNIRIADYARPSVIPVYPNKQRNLALAFLFSTLLAVAIAILWDRLDTTLRDPAEASRFLKTDVIATMPVDKAAAQLLRPKLSSVAPMIVPPNDARERGKGNQYGASSFNEAVRTLRNTILLSDIEGRLHSIVLTSAKPGEGKSTLAAHLAIAHADRGKKTLLVDGDLRRPSLHAKFALAPNLGLANVLTGELQWQDAVMPIEGTANLSLLPAGLGSHRAADLIGPRLSTLLDEFDKEYDMVILDSPPLLGFAECLQMASAADGVLIVSQAAETKRHAVAEVIATLHRVRANIVGVVLNQVSHNTSAHAYSYYGYNHYSGYRNQDPQSTQGQS